MSIDLCNDLDFTVKDYDIREINTQIVLNDIEEEEFEKTQHASVRLLYLNI